MESSRHNVFIQSLFPFVQLLVNGEHVFYTLIPASRTPYM